ncbi:RNA-binding domain-containing protein [Candidatus Nitrosotenuis chungbukensis]|uniref:RNA-binding domain-containing protein n=1 Tax=Candidatus Nitrosotenuis chungbukensis TaxID=1353246 RepID=UPI0005B2A27B|nr:RNA-binding domain-containing protein [Candidatus Nitrosotenuis chungbukensis]WKT58430.1 RNA-binding domain-containing protein [Candidatus Nitrosotenuis chungbukensis]
MIPILDCKIEAFCEINPSEDPEKIEQVMTNVLNNAEFKIGKGSITATSREIESLSKIRESIQKHRSQNVYLRFLDDNLDGDETWFYLNKQAAFVNSISLCEHADESALGPIKITLRSKNIERVIEWLTD